MMARQLVARGGAANPESTSMWTTYLNTIPAGQCRTEDMPAERLQELRNLCSALSMVEEGQLLQLADVLAQRFCSVEMRALGNRDVARSLELIQTSKTVLFFNRTPGLCIPFV